MKSLDVHQAAVIGDSVWTEGNSLVNQLRGIIYCALEEIAGKKLEISQENIIVSHPTLENYGDYTSNIAFIMAGRLRMKPFDIVTKLEKVINNYIKNNQTITIPTYSMGTSDRGNAEYIVRIKPKNILERAEAVADFLNLWLRHEYLITQLEEVLKDNNGIITTQMRGKKIAVEYTDPNPFKEFHLGHLYSNVIGESISRLFEACGARVWRGDFYGDVGMHVAKAVWGLRQKITDLSYLSSLSNLSLSEKVRFLGEAYALGVKKFDEDKAAAEEMKDINYLIYVASQEILEKTKGWKPIVDYKKYVQGREDRLFEISEVYEAGLRWSLEYFESIYQRLGTKFDGYYPESWVGEYGMKIVEKGLRMGILEKNDGAVVYKGEQDGLHTRVFVNKLGLPTYEAKDLGLAYAKYQDFPYDLSINVFGKEIDEYYKVVRAAMRKIEPELGRMANYIAHGMVKLPEGKMSSRTGNVITYEWLMEEAEKRALDIIKNTLRKSESGKDTSGGFSKKEMDAISEKVALGAIRYALLKSSLGNDVIFDFEKSISFEGDSGPYLQYTYARAKSVLRKSKVKSLSQRLINLGLKKSKLQFKTQNSESGKDTSDGVRMHSSEVEEIVNRLNLEELSLLRTIYKFPEVVAESAKSLSPSFLCEYLFDSAQKFNLFYSKHSILNPDNIQPTSTAGRHTTDNKEQDSDKDTSDGVRMPTCAGKHSSDLPAGKAGVERSVRSFRLSLTAACSRIIQQGLQILGIETVERM